MRPVQSADAPKTCEGTFGLETLGNGVSVDALAADGGCRYQMGCTATLVPLAAALDQDTSLGPGSVPTAQFFTLQELWRPTFVAADEHRTTHRKWASLTVMQR